MSDILNKLFEYLKNLFTKSTPEKPSQNQKVNTMPNFGTTSRTRMERCDSDVQKLLNQVGTPYACTVLE